jgi:tetratricopeptide (TPR) repeat protein
LAKVAKHTGDIEIALTSLKNAWELLPETVVSLMRAKVANEIGMCFALLEQHEEAYEWWYRAIEYDKHFVTPYFSLALSFEGNGRYAETESLLKQIIGLAPRDIRIYTHLARLFSMQARWDEAIVQYRQLVTLEPKDPWFHNDLANCYLQLGDMENAKKHFQRTVLLDPKGEAGKTASFIINSMETIEI